MINELLEFTRGSASTVVLARTDYADFVKQLIDDIRPEIAAKSVTLELENEPPEVALLVDPTRLAHVFTTSSTTPATPCRMAAESKFVSSRMIRNSD